METEPKKEYVRPVMQVVELQYPCLLQAASPNAGLQDYEYEDEQVWP